MLLRHSISPQDIGLRPADPEGPGHTRERRGRGFCFRDPHGAVLQGRPRARVAALPIPPAWTGVWIAPDPAGHLQALGQDAAGRRQYLYHQHWRAACEAAKFADLPGFAERLPALRRRVADLLADPPDRETEAMALIVRLLDSVGMRIGSRRRAGGAVGAVSLCRHHVGGSRRCPVLHYRGKGGIERRIPLSDPVTIAALGHFLPQARGPLFAGGERAVSAGQVNHFISETMKADYSAKDFRTWGGTVAAVTALRRGERTISAAAEAASAYLGNTPAIARRSYIHPAVIDAVKAKWPLDTQIGPTRLRADERRCLAIIDDWPWRTALQSSPG